MPDYTRLVSYIYNYEEGLKRNNVGYARVEARNGQCKCTLHIAAPSLNDRQLKAYLFTRRDGGMKGIQLGTLQIKNGIGEYRVITEAAHVMNTPYSINDMGGIVVYLSNNKFFATEWDDVPITLDMVSAMDEKKEDKKVQQEKSQIVNEMAQKVESKKEETKREESKKEEFKREESLLVKKDEVSKKETLIDQTSRDKNETIEKKQDQDNNEYRKDQEIYKSKIISEYIENRNIQKEKNILGDRDYQEERENHNYKGYQDDLGNLKDRDYQEDRDKRIYREYQEDMDGHKDGQKDRYCPEDRKDLKDRDYREDREDLKYREDLKDREDLYDNKDCEEDREELNDRDYQEDSENLNDRDYEEDNEELKDRDYDKDMQRRDNQNNNENINCGDYMNTKGDENVSYSKPNYEDHPLAKRIYEIFPRMYPFEDNDIVWCVRIEPQDIGLLPMEAWVLGNNSFLLHGYYSYRHLIFARINDRNGLNYILGVPGIYHNREKFMAKMFGFDNFKCVKKKELRTGEFGYWYIPIILM